MYGSASGPARDLGELCRLADQLFYALRTEFDIDGSVTVDLHHADTLSQDVTDEQQHIALMSLMSAQHLHHLGNPRSQSDVNEVFVAISALDALLNRLMNGRDDSSGASRRLRQVHSQLIDLGMRLPEPLLPAGEQRPHSR